MSALEVPSVWEAEQLGCARGYSGGERAFIGTRDDVSVRDRLGVDHDLCIRADLYRGH